MSNRKEKKLLYAKQFPRNWETGKPEPLDPESEAVMARTEEFLRRYMEESVTEPIPGKEEEAESFRWQAEMLSREYEIDAQIFRQADRVAAEFYFRNHPFFGLCKDLFADLILACDHMDILYQAGEERPICMAMEVYTHRDRL